MNLTQWWSAFEDDLDCLAPRVGNTRSASWQGARTMIDAGLKIEKNILWGLKYEAEINKGAAQLGSPFNNEVTGKWMPLPDVNCPESLLFALVYHKHLLRYHSINQGNPLVLNRLINERPGLQRDVGELKGRIDRYCSNPAHIQKVKNVFPDVARQKGATFFEQLECWLADESLPEKLIKQLEMGTVKIVEGYDTSGGEILPFFVQIENLLLEKINSLKTIVTYKKLIELLEADILLPDDLAEVNRLKNNYPDLAEQWLALDANIPQVNTRKSLTITGARSIISISRYAASVVSSLTQWTIGRFVPKSITDIASKVTQTVSHFVDAITPQSTTEYHKELLIEHATRKITESAVTLNISKEQEIQASDFKNMTAAVVDDLADKLQLIHNMVTLKKCLMLYQQQYSTSWVNFSLSAFFQSFTEFLSQSFLRRFIHDKVLLILEARTLGNKVDALVKSTKNAEEFDQDKLQKQYVGILRDTTQRTSVVSEESVHVFFKKENRLVSEKLTEIVSHAATVCPAGQRTL
jgi:hypothetical protein